MIYGLATKDGPGRIRTQARPKGGPALDSSHASLRHGVHAGQAGGRAPTPTILVALVLLCGCATRPGPEVLATVPPAPEAAQVRLYAATTRERAPEGEADYTAERARALNLAAFTISIPPGHQPASIEWPQGMPDAGSSFAVVGQSQLTRAEFIQEIGAPGTSGGRRNVGIFVHGYNHSFPEALFRLAQIAADSQTTEPQIAFSWPSQASVGGYVADKDSVTYSRDYLAELITDLAAQPNVGEINIIAHSMGGWLVMETVRQLRLQGRDAAIDRLNVVLAAPDIDADVFYQQLQVIGSLRTPLTVLVSPDDRALRVSQRLSASRQRLGALDVQDPRVQEVAAETNVQIIDISQAGASDGFRHDRYVSLATIMPTGNQDEGTGDIRQAGAFIFNAVGATLSTPFESAGRVLAGE